MDCLSTLRERFILKSLGISCQIFSPYRWGFLASFLMSHVASQILVMHYLYLRIPTAFVVRPWWMAKSLREIIFILLTTMIHPSLCSREKNRKETLSKTSISFNIGNERQASCGKQKKPNLIPVGVAFNKTKWLWKNKLRRWVAHGRTNLC